MGARQGDKGLLLWMGSNVLARAWPLLATAVANAGVFLGLDWLCLHVQDGAPETAALRACAVGVTVVAAYASFSVLTLLTGPDELVDGAEVTADRVRAKVVVGFMYLLIFLGSYVILSCYGYDPGLLFVIFLQTTFAWPVSRAVALLFHFRNRYPA